MYISFYEYENDEMRISYDENHVPQTLLSLELRPWGQLTDSVLLVISKDVSGALWTHDSIFILSHVQLLKNVQMLKILQTRDLWQIKGKARRWIILFLSYSTILIWVVFNLNLTAVTK